MCELLLFYFLSNLVNPWEGLCDACTTTDFRRDSVKNNVNKLIPDCASYRDDGYFRSN